MSRKEFAKRWGGETIQEKTRKREKRDDEVKTTKTWRYWVSSLDVRNECSLKLKKARSEALSSILSGSTSSAVLVCPDSQEEEVCSFIMRM